MYFEPKKWGVDQRKLATREYFRIFKKELDENLLKRLLLGATDQFHLNVRYSQLAQNYFKKIAKWKGVFRYIPFVEFVAVCNYLSLNIVTQKSDIDLFIVSSKKRIFTVKFFSTVLMHIMGLRRYGKKVATRFCLSFFVTEESLDLSPYLLKPYDIYFAYWILDLYPIYGKMQYWELFEKENKWTQDYFDNFESRRNEYEQSFSKSWIRKVLEFLLSGKIGNLVEALLKRFSLSRYNRSKSKLKENASVIVSDQVLKFHNNDRRELFRKQFEHRLKRSGLF